MHGGSSALLNTKGIITQPKGEWPRDSSTLEVSGREIGIESTRKGSAVIQVSFLVMKCSFLFCFAMQFLNAHVYLVSIIVYDSFATTLET